MKEKIDFKDKITIDDLNDNQYRIRRNLLIFSTIVIFYKIYRDEYKIKIKQIFGIIEFDDTLNPDILEKGLMFMILYFFIHWTLIVLQHLKFIRIRVTQNDGGRPDEGEWGDENFEKDYPKNPAESNLHFWFSRHFDKLNLTSSEIINSKKIIFEELEKMRKFDALIDKYFKEEKSDTEKLDNGIKELLEQYEVTTYPGNWSILERYHTEIKSNFNKILNILENIENENCRITNQQRLKNSIKNFDNWFNCYNKIERWRFIIIIHSFPLFLGLWSIFLLVAPC
jgi:hypothetical protein